MSGTILTISQKTVSPLDTRVKRRTVMLHSVAETRLTGRSPARRRELEASVPAQKSAPTTKGQF